MGGNSSREPTNNFSPSEWSVLSNSNDARVLSHNTNPSQRIEEHPISFADNQQLELAEQLYRLRNNDPQLVATKYINIHKQDELCSKSYSGNLYTEHIPIRLSNIAHVPFPDVLHLYNQSFNGFHRLSNRLGPSSITEECIGVNENHVAKVWHSPNFSQIQPRYKVESQQQMVRQIIDSIEENTDLTSMPRSEPSFRNFVYRENERVGFGEAKKKLQQYANYFNNGVIPNHLNCVERVGGARNIRNQWNQTNTINNQNSYPYNPLQVSSAHTNIRQEQQYGGPVGSNLPLDASFGQGTRTAHFSTPSHDLTRTTTVVNPIVPVINHHSSRVQSPVFVSSLDNQKRTQVIQNVGSQSTIHPIPNVSSYQSQINKVQTVQPKPVQFQNVISQSPVQVHQFNVPQTKVHVAQSQTQVQRPVNGHITSQINSVIPANKVNIGVNQQALQSRQITTQQGQINNIQHKPQTQVQPQILTQELPRVITKPLTVEQKPSQASFSFNPQQQNLVNQLVTENHRKVLPTPNNQIAIVSSPSQTHTTSQQFNLQPQPQNLVNQLVTQNRSGLLPNPSNQIALIPSQHQPIQPQNNQIVLARANQIQNSNDKQLQGQSLAIQQTQGQGLPFGLMNQLVNENHSGLLPHQGNQIALVNNNNVVSIPQSQERQSNQQPQSQGLPFGLMNQLVNENHSGLLPHQGNQVALVNTNNIVSIPQAQERQNTQQPQGQGLPFGLLGQLVNENHSGLLPHQGNQIALVNNNVQRQNTQQAQVQPQPGFINQVLNWQTNEHMKQQPSPAIALQSQSPQSPSQSAQQWQNQVLSFQYSAHQNFKPPQQVQQIQHISPQRIPGITPAQPVQPLQANSASSRYGEEQSSPAKFRGRQDMNIPLQSPKDGEISEIIRQEGREESVNTTSRNFYNNLGYTDYSYEAPNEENRNSQFNAQRNNNEYYNYFQGYSRSNNNIQAPPAQPQTRQQDSYTNHYEVQKNQQTSNNYGHSHHIANTRDNFQYANDGKQPTYSYQSRQEYRNYENGQLTSGYRVQENSDNNGYRREATDLAPGKFMQDGGLGGGELKYSMVEDENYNVSWDPEILADLQANVHRG